MSFQENLETSDGNAPTFLVDSSLSGEAASLMRAHDWEASPLGEPQGWPQPLKTLVDVMLASTQPMFIAWGPQRTLLYNDAYGEILAQKHPTALGGDFLDVWAEIRSDLLPIVEQAYSGEPVHMEDIQLLMLRRGYPEETHFTFSYTPVRDETGTVAGFFCPCTEITQQVLADRRRKFQLALEQRLRDAADPAEVIHSAAEALGRHLNVEQVAYAEVEPGGETVLIEREWNSGGMKSNAGRHRLNAFGLEFMVRLRQGERIAIADVDLDARTSSPDALEILRQTSIRAFINVPVMKGGRLVAVFAVHSASPRVWSDEDLAVTGEIAERTWSAIEHSRTEEALRRSEARLRESLAAAERRAAELHAVLESMPDAVYIGSTEGITIVNQPALDQLGFANSEELNRNVAILAEEIQTRDAQSGQPIALEKQAFARAFGGERVVQEVRVRHRLTGEERIVRCAAAPVVIDGRVIAAVAVNTDVTDAKNVEIALRELNETLEAQVALRAAERDRLWNLSQDMLARADYGGMMSAVSPAWTQVLGWSEAELLSRGYATFMHPEDVSPTLEAIERMAKTRRPSRFENRIFTKDGGWKPIEWTVAPEIEGDNFIAIGRDLTEVKARQEELSLAQEALRQAQKMEAVGQLTGGLAHDFNNIIAGISGSLQMMSTRLAQGRIDDLDRYIVGASGAAKRAAGLTQRLLAFSRRQTLEPKHTNLNALVEGMLDLVNRSMGPEIHVATVSAEALWTTFVDAGQLENALLNLCINARDAMPDGGKLTIETANRRMDVRDASKNGLEAGDYISLCVSDTGTGMPPDVMERAFDPFFTTKPIGQGTGLGLSMVYGFAGQSGGAVRIRSQVNEGTTVCLYLPRHSGSQADEQLPQVVEETPRANGGETVLLVDDEPLVRMVACEALEELGYTVIEAGEGKGALDILRSHRQIDLLVTDVGLPGGMNGRQVADAARENRPDLKVLFITGYAETAVLNHGNLDRGMYVMTKPFQMDAFARRVKDLLEE